MTELGPTGDIVIYPSSWYYNACVQGFLEVLAWGLGENGNQIIEEQILQNDGRAIIPGDLVRAIFSTDDVPMPYGYGWQPVPEELKMLKRIGWWWVALTCRIKGHEMGGAEMVRTACLGLFSKGCPYPNLAQHSWDHVSFLNDWFLQNGTGKGNKVVCSFCGQKYSPVEVATFSHTPAKTRVSDIFYTMSLSLALGNSISFPNRFWDGNPNLTMCRCCRSFFLCFHFVQNNRFFVNSDSLQINWYLNQLLSGKLRQNSYAYQTALFDAIQYDPQLRRGISNWGLQNLEILILERGKATYYPVSHRLARMFLVPRISSSLSRLSSPKLWEVILAERFHYLPIMIYKSLRVYLTKDNFAGDSEVIYNKKSMQPLVDFLTLCGEVIHFLSKEGGEGMDYVNIGLLRRLGAIAPLSQDDGLVFRLLELTRMNCRDDVYHLLLRVYVSRKMEFPSQLAGVFSLGNPGLFKTGIYAYISGLRPKGKAEADTN